VDFVCADMPNANKLTVHIMGLIAQEEREMISKRTKAALAAAKARGVKLGGYKGFTPTKEMGVLSARVRGERADSMAADLAPNIKEPQAAGKTSLRPIAEGLDEQGIPTARGGKWSSTQVMRVLDRPFEASASL
jgi:DNA invertase Pin-like site-specific DNA recombinase